MYSTLATYQDSIYGSLLHHFCNKKLFLQISTFDISYTYLSYINRIFLKQYMLGLTDSGIPIVYLRNFLTGVPSGVHFICVYGCIYLYIDDTYVF